MTGLKKHIYEKVILISCKNSVIKMTKSRDETNLTFGKEYTSSL